MIAVRAEPSIETVKAYVLNGPRYNTVVFTTSDNTVIDIDTLNPKPWSGQHTGRDISYRLEPIYVPEPAVGQAMQFMPEDESMADTINPARILVAMYHDLPVEKAREANAEFSRKEKEYAAKSEIIGDKYGTLCTDINRKLSHGIHRLQSIRDACEAEIIKAAQVHILQDLGPKPTLEDFLKKL